MGLDLPTQGTAISHFLVVVNLAPEAGQTFQKAPPDLNRIAIDAKLIRDAVRRVTAAGRERIGDQGLIDFVKRLVKIVEGKLSAAGLIARHRPMARRTAGRHRRETEGHSLIKAESQLHFNH